MHNEMREAALAAVPALERLCEAMRQKTGQSYKLRAMLYSLWNGQASSFVEVVSLDWSLRKDLCAVILAFGYGSSKNPDESFFYDAMEAELREAGLLAWFLEEFKESEVKA